MRYFLLTILIFSTLTSSAQKYRNGDGFNTAFKSISEGTFNGTVNGVLFCKLSASDVILDFQGSQAQLKMVPDPDEVYDTNTKVYSGQSTSGRTSVEYSTYAWANEITIMINGEEYQMTAIDGACDMVINGIDYFYQAEQESEYLVLFFSSDVELTNWQNLIRNTDESRDISKLRKQKRILTVSKNSTLTFAIKR
jgi:hypothetical protein